MNPASWLPLAAGREFTQPGDHLSADPCRSDPAQPTSRTKHTHQHCNWKEGKKGCGRGNEGRGEEGCSDVVIPFFAGIGTGIGIIATVKIRIITSLYMLLFHLFMESELKVGTKVVGTINF